MTINATSKAVQTFEACDIEGLGNLTPEDFYGIFQKYRRMEEALERIAKGFTNCENYNCKPCDAEAKEALAFDPLS